MQISFIYIKIGCSYNSKHNLRGRRLKGKGKGVSLAPKTPFPFPSKRLPRRLLQTLRNLFILVWNIAAHSGLTENRRCHGFRRHLDE